MLNVQAGRGVASQIFPLSPGKLLATVRGRRPQMSLWPKAASFLGEGEGVWGHAPTEKFRDLQCIFRAFLAAFARGKQMLANSCWAAIVVCERHNNKLGKTWRE